MAVVGFGGARTFHADGDTRSSVRPLTCSICGKILKNARNLALHNRTHTGERPYQCDYCDYAATQSSSLKRHIVNVHRKLLGPDQGSDHPDNHNGEPL